MIFRRANTTSDDVRALDLALPSSRTRIKMSKNMAHTVKIICVISQGRVGHLVHRDIDL